MSNHDSAFPGPNPTRGIPASPFGGSAATAWARVPGVRKARIGGVPPMFDPGTLASCKPAGVAGRVFAPAGKGL
jgi:hypothetical protein